MDLDKVCSLLETGLKEIKSLRNNFDDILAKAKALAIKWNIVPTFKQSQIKRTKKMFDGEVNFRLETAEHQFKVDVFNTVIDIITNQIDSRFTTLKTLKDVDSILDLLKLITITYCDMNCSFTEIIGVLTLYLTLPVSVATAERSFRTLKRIKTHLRTTMAQNLLSALSLLAFEAEEAAKLDLKDAINQFVAMKARKKKFR
nr:uncharacterized protein LOC124813954 [Hydra vulgaris]